MNRKDILDILNQAEQDFPVGEWKSGEMTIWPLIKRDIFFEWLSKKEELPLTQATPSSMSRLVKIFTLIKSLLSWILLKIRKPMTIDHLFCGFSAHRVDWEDRFINRYFQPIIIKNPDKSFWEIEYGQKITDKKYPNPRQMLFIEDYFLASLFFNRFKSNPSLKLPDRKRFEQHIQDTLHVNLKPYFNKLPQRLNGLRAYINIFNLIFRKMNPRKCWGLCYYSMPMFAMHYVANKHKVLNYDMQHGGQGSQHPMYTYSNTPKQGYNILPEVFWCWDKASAEHIAQWVDHQNFHKVSSLGNPWIPFQLNRAPFWTDGSQDIILYTLQEKQLEDYIIDTINKMPDNFVWWLRLHPRMLDAKDKIKKQLQDAGISEKVEIDRATMLPLPSILKNSKVHLSKFSGSIIEAAQVGTKTIIIDDIGIENYKEYILSGEAIPLPEKDSDLLISTLIRTINND